MDVSTEIQGSTNHAGAIEFLWPEYCLNSAPCTPNQEPPVAGAPNNGLSEVYIGNYNVPSTWWPNWNTCDVHDFNTSNC